MTRAVLTLTLLLAGPLAAQTPADARDARIVQAKGEVTLYSAQSPDGVAVEGDAEVPIEAGDRIVTGSGASAEVALDDGSLVTVDENSDFTLAQAQRSRTLLELAVGSIVAKIKKLAAGDTLEVRTPTAVAAVRGTEFGMEVARGKETQVGVFDEGRVEVRGDSGQPQVLEPNQETSVAKGAAPARARRLQRLMRRRQFMRTVMRRRLRVLAQRWKALPPERRKELRQKALERMHERRRERLEERRQRMQERRRQRRQR